ncbi:MAG: AAA family ATPase [Candidatus Omnitrophica bacterium]|nr:AAA family ATPase [Candidatus Omnitrophota bacterium]
MKNVVLVGFMGTGKTEVAKALAAELGREYVSLDELIVAREERPINEIFAEDGEAYFRKVEKEVVREVAARSGLVVDTGGGVVLDEENVTALKRGGIVICLWADAESIYERTAGSGHRPLLKVRDPKERIRQLLDYRRPFYQKADFHVDTDELDVAGVVERITGIVNAEEKDQRKTSE